MLPVPGKQLEKRKKKANGEKETGYRLERKKEEEGKQRKERMVVDV